MTYSTTKSAQYVCRKACLVITGAVHNYLFDSAFDHLVVSSRLNCCVLYVDRQQYFFISDISASDRDS